MMNNEIIKKLFNIFIQIARCEKVVEHSRKLLSSNPKFDVYEIYSYLDRNNKSGLESTDIMNYLLSKNVYIDPIEAEFLIQFYDKNQDKILSYSEYLSFVLPNTDSNLRQKARQRIGAYINNTNQIDMELEITLIHLFQKEIDLIRTIFGLLNEIKDYYKFNIHVLFHSITHIGFTFSDLALFLNNNNYNNSIYTQDDIKSIFRRLDIENDKLIDFKDFHAFFSYPNYCNGCNNTYPRECACVLKCNICKDVYPNYTKYNNSDTSSIIQNQSNIYKNKENEEIYANINIPENSDNNTYSKTLYLLMKYFEEIIKVELDIESTKKELVQKRDFNIEDAFKIFEFEGRGYIKRTDLKYGLKELGIYINDNDIDILFNRGDLQRKGYINYSDFFDLVTPFEQSYRRSMEQRVSNGISSNSSFKNNFNRQTLDYIHKFFNVVIQNEKKLYIFKKTFLFNNNHLFHILNNIDIGNKGFILYDDFQKFLIDNNFNYDATLIFIRLDKNRNGKIDFNELKYEFLI